MKTRLLRALLGSSLAWLGSACGQTPAPIHALFLGNSLTDGNDVPAIVQALAELQGVTFTYDRRTPGGWDLSDHWNANHAELLRTAEFDVLIMQQGPSTQPASQTHLRTWAGTWSNFARSRGTVPALFMIWPQSSMPGGFGLVSQSYRNAAVEAGAGIFAAGEAWNAALNRQPGLQLYSDDLHARPNGSLLAAMVIGRGLFGLDPSRVPRTVQTRSGIISVTDAEIQLFRSVVAELPATVLDPLPAPSPSTPSTPQTFPTPTGNTPGSAGGGGSPTLLATLLLALALACRGKKFGR